MTENAEEVEEVKENVFKSRLGMFEDGDKTRRRANGHLNIGEVLAKFQLLECGVDTPVIYDFGRFTFDKFTHSFVVEGDLSIGYKHYKDGDETVTLDTFINQMHLWRNVEVQKEGKFDYKVNEKSLVWVAKSKCGSHTALTDIILDEDKLNVILITKFME